MSKQTNTQTRRHFLKGAVYTSALSVSAIAISNLSSLAFANGEKTKASIDGASTSITLFNQSDKTVALDASNPVSLEEVKGWVLVKINKASEQSILNVNMDEIITLSAGQQLPFTIDSELAPLIKKSGDLIVITNEYSALNNMVPISTFDALVA